MEGFEDFFVDEESCNDAPLIEMTQSAPVRKPVRRRVRHQRARISRPTLRPSRPDRTWAKPKQANGPP